MDFFKIRNYLSNVFQCFILKNLYCAIMFSFRRSGHIQGDSAYCCKNKNDYLFQALSPSIHQLEILQPVHLQPLCPHHSPWWQSGAQRRSFDRTMLQALQSCSSWQKFTLRDKKCHAEKKSSFYVVSGTMGIIYFAHWTHGLDSWTGLAERVKDS